MTQLMQVMLLIVTLIIAFLLTAYLLGKLRICFVIPKEGTAAAITRSGGSFDHFILKWTGYCINDPRQSWYKPTVPAWEVMQWHPDNVAHPPSMYHFPDYWLAPLWRLFEHFNIYWYGLYPFKQVFEYQFDWTEQRIKENSNEYEPWHRKERTWFIYVKNFSYWIRLVNAKDKSNIPVDVDYLLTVLINNPFKALFSIADWLGRVSADANNRGKTYVGESAFEDLTRERTDQETQNQTAVNEFSKHILAINDNLLTEHTITGAPVSYGVTAKAVSGVKLTIAGTPEEKAALDKATTARIVAKKNAEAKVETAQGDAQAVRIAADAEKYAVDTVYDTISDYGPEGIAIRQLQAIEKSSAGPGNSIIWANNPILDAVKEGLKMFGPRTNPPAPPATTP